MGTSPNQVLKKRQILNNSNFKVEEGAMVDVSIIVPLFNEEESVGPMFSAIADALESVPGKAEVIFVDDGSSDNTFAVAEEIAAKDSRLRVVKFRRNYGQTPAMAAGIDVARGKTLVRWMAICKTIRPTFQNSLRRWKRDSILLSGGVLIGRTN
jgi:cellulose synthase/poly-beta-1,6-N-acetylglucosamine synthase-like glycosyltransferase